MSIPQNEILKYKSNYVQDLNEENSKTLMNYIKELSICHCSWIRKLNIVMILVLFNLIYGFNTISVKMLASCSVDNEKLILRFMC